MKRAFGPAMDRRQTLGLGLGAGAALLLPAGAQAATHMRFITPFNFSLSYAAVFHAKAGGFFDREGLDVEVQNGKGAATAATLVIAGQAEIARTGGANYITSRVDADAPLVSIATIAQVSPFFLVSSSAAPLTSAKDLAGKTIGVVSLGGSTEGTLDLMLRAAGVPAKSVNRVKVADVPASYALVQAKRCDGFMASISTVSKIRAAAPDAHFMAIDDGIPGQVYVASPKAIAERRDDYVKFLRAVYKSANAILDAKDTTGIITTIGKNFEIPGIDNLPIAKSDLAANARTWTAKGRDNLLRNVPELWASAVRDMAATGMIKKTPDAGSLYDNSLRDAAAKGA
jgi:NitT/TauT family transport system substrate-binding protein